MKDLAPSIPRQRLVIEGIPTRRIASTQIAQYLLELGHKLDMKVLTEPATHRSEKYGWAGWVHWESSGAHFYAWEDPDLFFSVDIYTCKPFEPQTAVDFTKAFFQPSAIEFQPF